MATTVVMLMCAVADGSLLHFLIQFARAPRAARALIPISHAAGESGPGDAETCKSDRNHIRESRAVPHWQSVHGFLKPTEGKTAMLDLIFLAATVVFVLLAVLYVQACEHLRLKK